MFSFYSTLINIAIYLLNIRRQEYTVVALNSNKLAQNISEKGYVMAKLYESTAIFRFAVKSKQREIINSK